MFKLMLFLDITEGKPGMLVPVFSSPNTNMPYVQQMDEFLLIKEMVPFLEYENYRCIPNVDDVPNVAVGDKGLIAFRSFDERIVCGDFEDALAYISEHADSIAKDPVLHLQLQRIESAELNPSYALWRDVSSRIFADESQSKFWLDSELLLYQKQKRIWAEIDPFESEEPKSGNGFVHTALNEYSTEYILRWLNNRANFTSKNWTKIWHYVHERLPFDDRVSQIATSWMYSLDADEDFEQSKSMIYALLQGWALLGKDFPDYGEFLSDRLATDASLLFGFLRPKDLFRQLIGYLAINGNLDDVLSLIRFSITELPKEEYIVDSLRNALAMIAWQTRKIEDHWVPSTHNKEFEQRHITRAKTLWDELQKIAPTKQKPWDVG